MLVESPFTITNRSGDIIRGDVRYLAAPDARPLLLVCHGFTAFKDWGPFPYVGRRLAEAGFVTLTFNFSHNGVGEDTRRFTEYERFSRNTPGKELEDVQAILRTVEGGSVGGATVDPGRIGMVGHSRGGAISILTAASDRRVGAVVAWATIGTFLRFTEDQRSEWIRTGYLPLRYGGARTLLRYHVSVLHDLEANSDRYNLRSGIAQVCVPTLFLHGSDDDIVRPEEAKELYEASDKALTEFVVLEGAGHTLGARHPFQESNPVLERMLDLTTDWFKRKL
jgi:dipeptidyl aminopeptidase/acylaminoacyl peptidase